MKVQGEFKFLGVEKRQGFKDPSQTFYVAGFAQGLDSLRCYVPIWCYSPSVCVLPLHWRNKPA